MSLAPELRCGRWQDVLADVEMVDAVITDPPYGLATHDACAVGVVGSEATADGADRRAISYAHWSSVDVGGFVAAWSPRCRGWFVALTSHDLVPAYRDALERAGRYVFAPLPFVSRGSRVRLAGDGPSSWTCWIVVARPRSGEFPRWGTLPGAYIHPPEDMLVVGGKPMSLMRDLVRDYSRPGDLICDPCAGGATTLRAAQLEGRRSIGAEMDPETYAKAMDRLRGWGPAEHKGTANLFGRAVG